MRTLSPLMVATALGCTVKDLDDTADPTDDCAPDEYLDVDGNCQADDTEAIDTGVLDTGETGYDPWDETGKFYSGEVYIDEDYSYWACAVADAYWYDIYTIGWTGGAYVDIAETGAGGSFWEESHWIGASYDYDPNGWWDNLYIELPIVDDWEDQINGVNTLFPCEEGTIGRMTWAVTVYYYESGSDIADCITWGDDPSYYTDYWSYCYDVSWM